MEPRLIVDESALHMLGAEAYDDLTMWFDVIATPTLVHEIISNLRKTNPVKKGRRPPLKVLQSTALLLIQSHAATPASFRKLVVGNMAGASDEVTTLYLHPVAPEDEDREMITIDLDALPPEDNESLLRAVAVARAH